MALGRIRIGHFNAVASRITLWIVGLDRPTILLIWLIFFPAAHISRIAANWPSVAVFHGHRITISLRDASKAPVVGVGPEWVGQVWRVFVVGMMVWMGWIGRPI